MRKGLILLSCILMVIIVVYFFVRTYRAEEKPVNVNEKDNFVANIYKSEVNDLIILKLAHYFPESHPQHIALGQKFIPMVESGSNWNIRVEVYPNSRLGEEKEYIEGVRNGTVEMCIGGQSLNEIYPKLQIIQLPYLFDDYDQVKELLNGKIGDKVTEGINSLGIESLAWSLNGFRQISTYDESLNIKQENLKLATSFSNINIYTLKALGFDPLPLTIDETTMVLKQKVADGHDNPPLLSYYNGWYENQSNVYITNHIISPAMYMVSSKFWDTLSDEHKDLIKKAAKESAEYEIELLEQTEKEIFNTLDKKGINIEYPDLTQYKNDVWADYNHWIDDDSEVINILDDILKEKKIMMDILKVQ